MSEIGSNREILLTIGQVTHLTGVSRSKLRHWESEFRDLIETVRTGGNQRRYTIGAVKKIEKIKELVDGHGLTLRGARQKLETMIAHDGDNIPEPELEQSSNIERLADLMSAHILKNLYDNSTRNVGNGGS